jgi:hypothetical protein
MDFYESASSREPQPEKTALQFKLRIVVLREMK